MQGTKTKFEELSELIKTANAALRELIKTVDGQGGGEFMIVAKKLVMAMTSLSEAAGKFTNENIEKSLRETSVALINAAKTANANKTGKCFYCSVMAIVMVMV